MKEAKLVAQFASKEEESRRKEEGKKKKKGFKKIKVRKLP